MSLPKLLLRPLEPKIAPSYLPFFRLHSISTGLSGPADDDAAQADELASAAKPGLLRQLLDGVWDSEPADYTE